VAAGICTRFWVLFFFFFRTFAAWYSSRFAVSSISRSGGWTRHSVTHFTCCPPDGRAHMGAVATRASARGISGLAKLASTEPPSAANSGAAMARRASAARVCLPPHYTTPPRYYHHHVMYGVPQHTPAGLRTRILRDAVGRAFISHLRGVRFLQAFVPLRHLSSLLPTHRAVADCADVVFLTGATLCRDSCGRSRRRADSLCMMRERFLGDGSDLVASELLDVQSTVMLGLRLRHPAKRRTTTGSRRLSVPSIPAGDFSTFYTP